MSKARRRLSDALSDLESLVREKIEEAMQQKIVISGLDNEQSLASRNLFEEINRLQKDLLEVGNEVEIEREKNVELAKKVKKFTSEKDRLTNAIATEIAKIEKILK